ncbi:MAG: hypothetical protein Q8M20_00820 [Rhodocyclaceae bacterium]|nr:hypothetical protein [Rhodocyclaceae bacterium]MDZ4214964.1 hypothetical protein [Rhodocyclaceae bacterium]
MRVISLLSLCGFLLAGCDQLGLETPAQLAAVKEAEGRAVGGACRHSGRALEDCYTLNPKAQKAAVFTGWRDMDAYMRENNIEVVPAQIPKTEKKKATVKDEAADKVEDTPVAKDAAHGSAEPAMPAPGPGGKMV